VLQVLERALQRKGAPPLARDLRGSFGARVLGIPILQYEPGTRRTRLVLHEALRLRRQLLVAFDVYAFVVGSFNHVQMSSGVQVQGHPAEQLPLGF
jgi:hypothetical protein